MQQITRFDPSAIILSAYEKAAARDHHGAARELLEHMDEFTALGSSSSQLAYMYSLSGECCMHLKQWTLAEELLRRATRMYLHIDAVEAAKTSYRLAYCLYSNEQWLDGAFTFAGALERYQALPEKHPERREIGNLHVYTGAAYCNAGKYDRAEPYFEQAFKHASKASDVNYKTLSFLISTLLRELSRSKTPRMAEARLARRACRLLTRRMASELPPPTVQEPSRYLLHGQIIRDPFQWLEALEQPRVRSWVETEGNFSRRYLDALPGRNILHERVFTLHADLQPQSNLGWRTGAWHYFKRTPHGFPRAQICRTRKPGQFPHVLIDANDLPDGDILTDFSVSPNGRFLAYQISPAGSQFKTVQIKDLHTGEHLPECVEGLGLFSMMWSMEPDGFWYYAVDENDREGGMKLRHHTLGTPQQNDLLIYQHEDPDLICWLSGFARDQYLIVSSAHRKAQQHSVFLIPTAATGGTVSGDIFMTIVPPQKNKWQFTAEQDGLMYFVTDWRAPRGQLVSISIDDPKSEPSVVIPQQKDTMRSVVFCGPTQLTGIFSSPVSATLRAFSGGGRKAQKETRLPPLTSIDSWGYRPSGKLILRLEGPALPPTDFEYGLTDGSLKPAKSARQRKYNHADYETRAVMAKSADGTEVPIYVTGKKPMRLNGDNPLLLTAYGGFGVCAEPEFNPYNLAWLERDGMLAQAVIRGGGEFGKQWRNAGMRTKKQNCFDDFIAAAEYLIEEGYTRPARLGIYGASNGGLLVGGAMTQRPELFGAVYSGCGLLDMLRFDQLGIADCFVAEYGSPRNKKEFSVLRSYSPLHNVRRRQYPPTLLCAFANDEISHPAHTYKFAAALQAKQTAENPILLVVEQNAGHEGHYESAREIDRLAFFSTHLGLLPDVLLREAAERWKQAEGTQSMQSGRKAGSRK